MKINNNTTNIEAFNIQKVKKQNNEKKIDKKKVKDKKKSSILFVSIDDTDIENNINDNRTKILEEFFNSFLEEEIKNLKTLKPIIHKPKKDNIEKEKEENLLKLDKPNENNDEEINNNFNWLDIQNND